MTRIQLGIVVFVAVVGFTGLGIAGEVKSIMDEPAVVEPVVRMSETKQQFIDRINRENLNAMYPNVMQPDYRRINNRHSNRQV